MKTQCQCQQSRAQNHHDLEDGFRRLSSKVSLLAECMSKYVRTEVSERSGDSEMTKMAAMLERIVGGVPVGNGEYPECCLVGERLSNGTMNWFCTGVLVSPRIVLTAAHCHQPPNPRANIVALKAENMNQLGNAKLVSVRRAVANSKFPVTGNHDIAVLILRSDAQVTPVPIATTAEIGSATQTTLVGFGNSDVLSSRGFGVKRHVQVPITNVRRSPSDNFDSEEMNLGFESDLEFTAGGNGFDSCNGDSGGPAYIMVNGVRKLAGLTSSGFNRSATPCGEGGIYTRVDMQLAFIREVAQASNISF